MISVPLLRTNLCQHIKILYNYFLRKTSQNKKDRAITAQSYL